MCNSIIKPAVPNFNFNPVTKSKESAKAGETPTTENKQTTENSPETCKEEKVTIDSKTAAGKSEGTIQLELDESNKKNPDKALNDINKKDDKAIKQALKEVYDAASRLHGIDDYLSKEDKTDFKPTFLLSENKAGITPASSKENPEPKRKVDPKIIKKAENELYQAIKNAHSTGATDTQIISQLDDDNLKKEFNPQNLNLTSYLRPHF
jgi:hypothetical protein